jgi:LytS/YehU family sensor histidine kinase
MCVDKAPEAAETTVLFSNFLRGNLSSLTRNEPISFEKELMHTRTYLELEQRRFLERLQVIYDIQTMDFSIPPLTLQPIAENAVKHGISERTDGGKVWISSFEEETEYVVEVRDNGVGFDIEAAPDTSRDHIGMENVKSRLNLLCHGRMTVESIKGQGTKVQIRIPKIKL